MSGNKVHDKPKCEAKTRAGSPCQRPAGWGTDHAGSGRCKLHGGKSTGAKTGKGKKAVSGNAITHGGYVDRILNDVEKQTYDWLHDATIDKHGLDREDPVQMSMLHRAAITYIKMLRLDEWELEEKFEPHDLEKDPETGKVIPTAEPVFNKDGEIVEGQADIGRLRRLQWAKVPNWEAHFQKYMAMLAVDRKSQSDQEMGGKVIDAFGWLWGNSEESVG